MHKNVIGDGVWLVEHLSSMQEALGNALYKLDMVGVVHDHNPSTREVKNGRLEIERIPGYIESSRLPI